MSMVLKMDYCFPSKEGVEFDKQEEGKRRKRRRIKRREKTKRSS